LLQNEKNRDLKQKPLILFSPLDWGLGHTVRCIPLMRYCQQLGYQIVVACNSIQKKILQQEMDGLSFQSLPGYDVSYGETGIITKIKLACQLNNILTKIKLERRWLRSFVDREQLVALISDNRYGLWDHRIPCVIITHQLQPISGFGSVANKIVRHFHYKLIQRFQQCWVPDYGTERNLAGKLSHPAVLPRIPVNYIGMLSRYAMQPANDSDQHIDLLIVLSGPEPQRSIFENKILNEVKSLDLGGKRWVLVRGLVQESSVPDRVNGLELINFLDAAGLQQMLQRSNFVLSRSGYTSLMEHLSLRKKMILVPTPGQTEQEYLADYMMQMGFAVSMTQHEFGLASALEKAKNFNYRSPEFETNLYHNAVDALLRPASAFDHTRG
jgi:uncharacterized protein (TIGR00661 family)